MLIFTKSQKILVKISKKLELCKNLRSNCNSKKWIIWFIMISPAKFQPPNLSITASNCIPRFWSFGRFVWKSKKLPNFFIFKKLFIFFVLDLMIWVFKSAPRWVFIKIVFGLEIIRVFRNFVCDFVWKNQLIANFAEWGLKWWESYLLMIRRQIL